MGTPSAAQQARLIAPSYDVEFRYYTADLSYDAAELLNISVNSTYPPSGDFTAITEIVTSVSLSDGWDMQGACADWQASLRGQNYDPLTIGPEKCVLAMRRLYDSSWSDWWVWWCGWIKAMPGVFDDYREGGNWQVDIGSLSVFTKTDDAPALRFGKTNIARGKSATASSTLGNPALEQGRGEFMGLPSLAASMAVDGNMDTLWVSSGAPSTTEEVPSWPGDPHNYSINEVFREPTGFDETYRWLEIFCRSNAGTGFQWLKIHSRSTGKTLDFHTSGVTDTLASGEHAIICFDERHFRELFDPGSAVVVEWRHLVCTDWSDGENWNYDPTADVIVVTENGYVSSRECVAFGLANDPESTLTQALSPGDTTVYLTSTAGFLASGNVCAAGGDVFSYTAKTATELTGVTGVDSGANIGVTIRQYAGWHGAVVAAPSAGKSIRRDPAGTCGGSGDASANWSNADDFSEEDYPSPGRHHASGASEWEWLAVDLGTLSFALSQELVVPAAGTTTAYITPSTDGMTMMGQILIDGDILAYTGRTVDTLMGVSGAAETYPVDTALQQYEGGAATDHWKVNEVGWKRPSLNDGTTPIAPRSFAVFTSTEGSPVYPPNANWGTDWLRKGPWVGGYESAAWMATIKPGRYRHIMLVVRRMNGDGRAKLNEMRVHPAHWTITGGSNPRLADGTLDAIFEHLLVSQLGLNSAQVSCDYNGFVGDFEIAKSRYHRVITELAKQAGLVVRYNRDPTISIVRDPSFPLHGTIVTRDTLGRAECLDMRFSKLWTRIRQVQVMAYNPEEERSFTAVYPPSPSATGETIRIPIEYILGNEQQARDLATRIFHFQSMHQEVGFRPVGPVDDWLELMDRVRCNWDLEPADGEVDKLFLIRSTNVTAEGSTYVERISAVEYVP